MALIAWYKLDGNGDDSSGNGYNLVQGVTPSYADGKISQAITTGSYSWSATTAAAILNNNELSISLWLYVGGATGTGEGTLIFGVEGMTAPNNRKFTLFQYPSCNDLHWSWQNDITNEIFAGGVLYGVLPSGQWTHICITYKNPDGKIYINGVLNTTFSGISQSASFAFDTPVIWNSIYHKIDDYRFYNHALSAKEIKLLSQAKILHYPFDDPYEEPTENVAARELIPYAPYNTLTRVGQNLTITMVNGGAQYLTFHNNVDYYGKIISMSGYIFKNGAPHNLSYGRANTYHTVPASRWYFDPITGYFEIIEICDTSSIWLFHTPAGTTGTDIITINKFQIEVKDHITPFTENIRSGIIMDISGYANNGIISLAKSAKWTSTHKYGTGAFEFNGVGDSTIGQAVIVVPAAKVPIVMGVNNAFTLSFWYKPTNTEVSAAAIIRKGGEFEIYKSGTKLIYRLWNPTSTDNTSVGNLIVNNWNHIVITHDGISNAKLYLNNSLDLNFILSGAPSSTVGDLSIGAYTDATWACSGIIDDIMVFATALSATDISLLYGRAASIDNQGNFYAKEFIEAIVPENYKINSEGQAIFDEIDEVNGTSSGQAAQIINNGKLIINGEFNEVD